VSFLADNSRVESIVDVLGTGDLIDVPPPCFFAILAAYSWVAFLPKWLSCVNVAFSYAKASH
jgi:hypothetical protein